MPGLARLSGVCRRDELAAEAPHPLAPMRAFFAFRDEERAGSFGPRKGYAGRLQCRHLPPHTVEPYIWGAGKMKSE